jgi:integrase
MPREATGELRPLADGFAARITIHGRDRKDFVLAACANETEAGARCKALASMAARLRRAGHTAEIEQLMTMGAAARAGRPWEAVRVAVDTLCAGQAREKSACPTFGEFAKEWTDGALSKKHPDHVREKRSATRDEELLRLHVLPHVADVRLDDFQLHNAEIVMANLSGKLSPGTRRHVAQVMSRLMNLAVYPGKWIKASPIPRGWLPRAGDEKAKECLYPDEDRALLACGDIVLLRRMAYGFLTREGMRTDELARLTWGDVDLVHNRVDLDENKTDKPRSWDMRPDVLVAIQIWRKHFRSKAKTTDRVFVDDEGVGLNVDHLATQLRDDLKLRAKIDRPKLFAGSKSRLRMRAHDLRATFITVSLASGRTWEWCQQRTGHGDSMKQKYRRTAATWIAQQQGDLAPMHLTISELAAHAGSIAPRLPHGGGSGSAQALPKSLKVHGTRVELVRLAAAEPKSAASASFATRAVDPWGIRGEILTGGSVDASSWMMESAEPRHRDDPTHRWRLDIASGRRVTLERHVGSVRVVIRDVLAEDATQVVLAEDDQGVDDLPSRSAHPSFGEPVLTRVIDVNYFCRPCCLI